MKKRMIAVMVTGLLFIFAGCGSGGGDTSSTDVTAPEISIQRNITLEVGDAFDPWSYIEVIDNTDSAEDITLEIDDNNVDTTVPGDYSLTVSASDKAGNTSVARMFVTVNGPAMETAVAEEAEQYTARAIIAIQNKVEASGWQVVSMDGIEYSTAEGLKIVFAALTINAGEETKEVVYGASSSPEMSGFGTMDQEVNMIAFDLATTGFSGYVTKETILQSDVVVNTATVFGLIDQYNAQNEKDILGIL